MEQRSADFDDFTCQRCSKPILHGQAIQCGDIAFHPPCFKCTRCDCDLFNFMDQILLSDNKPFCPTCSYFFCTVCEKIIFEDEAIMAGDKVSHVECFRCIACKKRIDNLEFVPTKKGIYCHTCRDKRKDETSRRKQPRALPLPVPEKDAPTNLNSPKKSEVHPNTHSAAMLTPPRTAASITTNTRPPTPPTRSCDDTADKRPVPHTTSTPSQNTTALPSPTSSDTVFPTINFNSPKNDLGKSALDAQLSLPSLTSFHVDFFEDENDQLADLTRSLGANLKTINEMPMESHRALMLRSSNSFAKAIDILSNSLRLYDLKPDNGSPPIASVGKDPRDRDVPRLRGELKSTSNRLRATESRCEKLKEASRNALAEVQRAKDDYHREMTTRRQLEYMLLQLHESSLQTNPGVEGLRDTTSLLAETEIYRLAQMRVELEATISELRTCRDKLSSDIVESLGSKTQAHLAHQDTAKDVLQAEIEALREERDSLQAETENLNKMRDNVLQETVMLNVKNAELSTMNNDLSTRVTQREREQATTVKPTPSQTTLAFRRSTSDFGTLFQRRPDPRKLFKGKFKMNRKGSAETPSNTSFYSLKNPSAMSSSQLFMSQMDLSQSKLSYDSSDSYRSPLSPVPRQGRSHDVPRFPDVMFVKNCIQVIETHGLNEEGIYRKSGGASETRKLRDCFERGDFDVDIDDVHAASSVLKSYLRDLSDPLLTSDLRRHFVRAARAQDTNMCADLIHDLPRENNEVLVVLMRHLSRIQRHSNENLMTTKNLATVFGITLMIGGGSDIDISDCNHTIEFLIRRADTIFALDKDQISASSSSSFSLR